MDLEVVVPSGRASQEYSLRGTCPHCRAKASFTKRGASDLWIYSEPLPDGWIQRYPVMQCAACLKFILAVVRVKETKVNAPLEEIWLKVKYETHYPTGTPDDSVAEEVPEHIAVDFREALRCRWVDGYNATVEMCRRAIEVSCLELGAKPKLSITAKIDWVHKQGRINGTLKKVAHKIRLGGNRGSHPTADPTVEPPITADEADAVIAFTRHYLDHVYVVETRLGKYDFTKAGRKGTPKTVSPTATLPAEPPKAIK